VHDTTSIEAIHFLNTGGRETFIPAPIYTCSAITFLQQKTKLVNLTAVRYILQPHLMHVIDRQKEFFQQDNARPHTAHVAMDYHEQNNINVGCSSSKR
jgi:hypothetical protein